MSRKKVNQAMSPDHVRAVQERRRSNAAGTHIKRVNKGAEKRRAIREQE